VSAASDDSVGATGAMAVLRGNPAFRSLIVARVVSFVGDALSLVALMVHVAQTTGQALAVAALLLAGDFVPSLLSPITGAISDRFDRRRVMITCELVQAGLLVLIAASLPPLPVLLGLVAARAIGGQVFQPASRAAVPALVPARDLGVANSTLGFGTNGAEALGPLLAAALLPLLGIRGVLLVDAVSFLVSAVLLARLPALGHAPVVATPGLFSQAREGLGYIWSVRPVRIIALGFCGIVAVNGIDDVALLVLATDTFGAGESAVALLLGAVGIGLLAGYVLLARVASRVTMPVLLIAGFAISSVGNLLTGLAWAVAVAFALQVVRGLGLAAMDVASNTLVQQLVPDRMLGRVFGNLYGLIGVAAGVSYLGGGLLLDTTSAPVTFVAVGVAGTMITVLVALALRAAPTASKREPDA
jgi:MFS family permease